MNNKISFYSLTIEVTQKCNLKCGHCFRGDSQDVDLSCKTIDKLLDMTNAIYQLQITGGEPMLALDQLEHLLTACRERNVVVLSITIPTNGTILNDRVVKLVKDWGDYIKQWLTADHRNNIKDRVVIGVSTDIYHGSDKVTRERFEAVSQALESFATVFQAKGGNIPFATGRAKDITFSVPDLSDQIHKICYKIGHSRNVSNCSESYQATTFGENQVIICCGLTMDTNGNFPARLQHEWNDDSNPVIFNVWDVSNSEEVLNAIDVFNENYPDCKTMPADDTRVKKYKSIIKTHPFRTEALIRDMTPAQALLSYIGLRLTDEQLANLDKIYSEYNNRYISRIEPSQSERQRIQHDKMIENPSIYDKINNLLKLIK